MTLIANKKQAYARKQRKTHRMSCYPREDFYLFGGLSRRFGRDPDFTSGLSAEYNKISKYKNDRQVLNSKTAFLNFSPLSFEFLNISKLAKPGENNTIPPFFDKINDFFTTDTIFFPPAIT